MHTNSECVWYIHNIVIYWILMWYIEEVFPGMLLNDTLRYMNHIGIILLFSGKCFLRPTGLISKYQHGLNSPGVIQLPTL